MIDEDVLAYATLLYSSLIEAAPKDTGNLANKIKMTIIGDEVKIEISPGVYYSGELNERKKTCKRHHKSHYHWIQSVCEQIGNVYASTRGGICTNEFE